MIHVARAGCAWRRSPGSSWAGKRRAGALSLPREDSGSHVRHAQRRLQRETPAGLRRHRSVKAAVERADHTRTWSGAAHRIARAIERHRAGGCERIAVEIADREVGGPGAEIVGA